MDGDRIQKHIADHLRQVALHSLPKVSEDQDEDTDSDALSAKALGPNVGSRQSVDTQKDLLRMTDGEFDDILRNFQTLDIDSPTATPPELEDPETFQFLPSYMKQRTESERIADEAALMRSFGVNLFGRETRLLNIVDLAPA